MIHFIVVYVDHETSKVVKYPITAFDKITAWNTVSKTVNKEITLMTIYKNPYLD